ncbi:MFS transporter [Carnimonas nigrificans]|uniref:MFS transporter n=1 Tax=Carnimonas nigrificans TaxID=64323 RepID=UPI00047227C7|nr:MFS transporter [Carnimonas nigrificans]
MRSARQTASPGQGLRSHQEGDDGLPPERRLPALWSILLSTLLVVLDGSMMSTALPHLGQALGVAASSSVWISNGYQLIAASLILSCAALADRIGPSRLYIAGLALFVVASLGCALAQGFSSLLVWRCIQGVGAAAVMSLGPSLNRRIFPSRLLGSGIGIVAMVVAAALAIGPAFTGIVLAIADWRWLFLVNIPVGGAALVMAWRFLPREAPDSRGFDGIGALLSIVMLSTSVVGLGLVGHAASATVAWGWLAVAVIAAVAFIIRQRCSSRPLLPLSMFAEKRFSMAALASLFSFIAQTMALFALPFLLQNGYGYSPLASGLLFTPWPLLIMVVAPLTGRLADRVSAPRLAVIGSSVFALAVLSLALMALFNCANVAVILLCTALCGLGFAVFQSPNNRELMGSVPRHLSSRASGVQATVRTFAQAIGAALVALTLSGADVVQHSGALINNAFWIAWVFALIAVLCGCIRLMALRQMRL